MQAPPVTQPPEVPEPATYEDEGWPEPPSPRSEQITDEFTMEIITLLDRNRIAYEVNIDGCDGTITANSYDKKDLLKSAGFRWSSDLKRWIFNFTQEPF